MHLVVGLGNPGERYRGTRHNVAWPLLEELRRRWDAVEEAPVPLYRSCRARVGEATVVLMKPLTFMNRAGEAVEAWLARQPEPTADLLVVSDDVYLPVGTLRMRMQGSSGGHRGLESIEQVRGGRPFARLRLGVGAATSSAELREHVLDRFTPDEQVVIDEVTRRGADAVECWVVEGGIAAMNRFNRGISKEVPEP